MEIWFFCYLVTYIKQLGEWKVILRNFEIFSDFEAVKVEKPRKNDTFFQTPDDPGFFSNWIYLCILSYSTLHDVYKNTPHDYV